ncbi:MAG: NADH-quinone oxidoreductase subunit C [Chloroflexota bacterium]
MTQPLNPKEVSRKLSQQLPGRVLATAGDAILINQDQLLAVATYLKETPGLRFNYLANLTSVDYYDYFEVVYHLTSLEHNHSLVIKTRVNERDNPKLDSVAGLWRGADLQEREIYDLMGIAFQGHPNMKRIFLWEGFEGHPLRKDYV